MAEEKIFIHYGFDINISINDTFSLTALGGILFLFLVKQNGTEIISRRRVVDNNGATEPFDINKLTKSDKEELVRRFLKLDTSQSEITRFLGLSSSYIGNLKRSLQKKGNSHE